MKKWSKKKKITILLLFLVLLALFAGLCWKKRRGIYNTYMKLTNQEIPYSVKEKRKKKYISRTMKRTSSATMMRQIPNKVPCRLKVSTRFSLCKNIYPQIKTRTQQLFLFQLTRNCHLIWYPRLLIWPM